MVGEVTRGGRSYPGTCDAFGQSRQQLERERIADAEEEPGDALGELARLSAGSLTAGGSARWLFGRDSVLPREGLGPRETAADGGGEFPFDGHEVGDELRIVLMHVRRVAEMEWESTILPTLHRKLQILRGIIEMRSCRSLSERIPGDRLHLRWAGDFDVCTPRCASGGSRSEGTKWRMHDYQDGLSAALQTQPPLMCHGAAGFPHYDDRYLATTDLVTRIASPVFSCLPAFLIALSRLKTSINSIPRRTLHDSLRGCSGRGSEVQLRVPFRGRQFPR